MIIQQDFKAEPSVAKAHKYIVGENPHKKIRNSRRQGGHCKLIIGGIPKQKNRGTIWGGHRTLKSITYSHWGGDTAQNIKH